MLSLIIKEYWFLFNVNILDNQIQFSVIIAKGSPLSCRVWIVILLLLHANLDHLVQLLRFLVAYPFQILWLTLYLSNLAGWSSNSPFYLPWLVRIKIAKGVARGLAYLHGRKFVHANIKPTNILLSFDMEPYIADFGLQKLLDTANVKYGSFAIHRRNLEGIFSGRKRSAPAIACKQRFYLKENYHGKLV